jgi:hypothetical protein
VLEECGFGHARSLTYGASAGYALEWGRNLIARYSKLRHASFEERTLASGRWLQPPEWASPLLWAVARPLGIVDRALADDQRGTGVVALAQRS